MRTALEIFIFFRSKVNYYTFYIISDEGTVKVFISWSGQRSKAVAEIFSDWLKCVIQASQPWISTRDIDRGAIWFSEINDKLKDVSVGVVFLTQDNKNKPWILFETGALAKGLTTNRVCTFLIDLHPQDLQDPLAQFNHTTPTEGSVWELMRTINACLAEKALDERILKQVFDIYWDQLNQKINVALIENPPDEIVPPRSEQDILTEILNNTRTLAHKVRALENNANVASDNLKNVRQLSKIDTFRLQSKIEDIIKTGITDEDEIFSLIGNLGLPDLIIKDYIRYELRKSDFIKNANFGPD